MDLTNIIGEAENVAAKFGLADEVKAQIAALGVSPALMSELEGGAQQMLAGGVNKEEMATKLAALAESKGIPAGAVDMVMKAVAAKQGQ